MQVDKSLKIIVNRIREPMNCTRFFVWSSIQIVYPYGSAKKVFHDITTVVKRSSINRFGLLHYMDDR